MGITSNRLSQEQYAENFSDIHPPFETTDAALVEANRCLFCYDAPCMKSCPTGIDVPKFIKQIATENIKRHQSFTTLIGLSWQPGVRYIEFPDRKISLGM